MEKMAKNLFKSSLISSLVLLVLGILLIFQSETTIVTISYVVGGILVAIGVMAFLRFTNNKETSLTSDLDVVYGVVTVILGVLIITNPHAIASIIPLIIGAGIIINGATKLQYAFDLKTSGSNIWKSTMVIAVVSTICGVVLIFNPFKGAVLITKIIGIFIVCYALLDIISAYMIKKGVEDIKSSSNIIEADVIEVEAKEKTKKEQTKKEQTKKTNKKTTKGKKNNK